jgi:uncharacterized protein
MKFLLVFLVVLVVAWRWRAWRESKLAVKSKAHSDQIAKNMVPCRLCGVHIPAGDAQTSALGSYCSAAHRVQMEG